MKIRRMDYLYYYFNSEWVTGAQAPLAAGYSCVLWRPSGLNVAPAGLPIKTFGAWWLFHHLRIFSNRDYWVLLIFRDSSLVHQSVLTPRYFRFPFMGKDDLQIGNTWTDAGHRGRGLAGFAIRHLIEMFRAPGRRFWYVVERDNSASMSAVKKAGFKKFGEGERTRRLGLEVLGSFEVRRQLNGTASALLNKLS